MSCQCQPAARAALCRRESAKAGRAPPALSNPAPSPRMAASAIARPARKASARRARNSGSAFSTPFAGRAKNGSRETRDCPACRPKRGRSATPPFEWNTSVHRPAYLGRGIVARKRSNRSAPANSSRTMIAGESSSRQNDVGDGHRAGAARVWARAPRGSATMKLLIRMTRAATEASSPPDSPFAARITWSATTQPRWEKMRRVTGTRRPPAAERARLVQSVRARCAAARAKLKRKAQRVQDGPRHGRATPP